MNFKYKWWGKGEIDASFGVFFDGFSKIFTAIGMMTFVFGMPADITLGKILPAIGISTFLGNIWYFYEAKKLAYKEKRSDVTAQPFGVGGAVVMSWLFLIMGPVFWSTGDAMLAFRVGLAASFIGGIIEIIGAFIGRWLVKVLPRSALLGNLAGGAFVWLGITGIIITFDKPQIALIPLFIIFMNYVVKSNRRLKKIPVGIIAIVIGTIIGWVSGYMSPNELVKTFDNISFYLPGFFVKDILIGLKSVVPYLPIIIPLQIANFLTTLQGVESAKVAGDTYPERLSMFMDGMFTLIGSFLGNPFPTTVYYGHPSWKAIDARGGYSILVGSVYLIVCLTGLAGVMMAIVPYEVVMILLIFVGLSVTNDTVKNTEKKYIPVIFIAIIPILVEYIKTLINGALQAAGTTIDKIDLASFQQYNVAINGVKILGSGSFLSSLLIAAWLACIVDKEYIKGSIFALMLAICSFIGLIHSEAMTLFSPSGNILGLCYIIISLITYQKNFINDNQSTKLKEE